MIMVFVAVGCLMDDNACAIHGECVAEVTAAYMPVRRIVQEIYMAVHVQHVAAARDMVEV